MKKILHTTLFLFLLSCTSEHEQKALEKLSNTYGADISITNGVSTSTDGGTVNYKSIDVSNCSAYEKGLVNPELIASSISITFFDMIDSSDKDFDQLNVELNKSDGTIFSHELSINYLEILKAEYSVLKKWTSELEKNQFDSAYQYLQPLNPNLPTFDVYKNTTNKLVEKYGQVDSVLFDGFFIIESTDSSYQGKINQFVYTIKGSKGNYGLSVQMIPTDKNLKIQGLAIEEFK
jgi:hypothetical protein